MRVERQVWSLNRWQTITLIVLQLLFAACATSVLIYRAQGWAPEVINFGWLSYRACNIYISLALVAYFVVGLRLDKKIQDAQISCPSLHWCAYLLQNASFSEGAANH